MVLMLGAILDAPEQHSEPGPSMSAGEESQHAIMSVAMINARRARMRVEADRQLLANRIARLQAEEMRSVKRIEETHKKTQEILQMKARHQQSEFEKEASKMGQEDAVEKHRLALLEMKEQQRIAIIAARQSQAIVKASQAREAKRVNEENAIAIARSRGAEFNAAAFRRNAVRQDQEAARDRRQKEKELLLAHLQERSEAREGEEVKRAQEYAEQMAKMQEEERRLVEALHLSQEEQRQVFASVEQKLAVPKLAPAEPPLFQGGFRPSKSQNTKTSAGRTRAR